ncbi:MAG: hypothetical protein OEX02_11735 [Cyclobacteriaceae bacterium]|nr:hypothetical protein [Cyclobacteriaceae bacterium]
MGLPLQGDLLARDLNRGGSMAGRGDSITGISSVHTINAVKLSAAFIVRLFQKSICTHDQRARLVTPGRLSIRYFVHRCLAAGCPSFYPVMESRPVVRVFVRYWSSAKTPCYLRARVTDGLGWAMAPQR